MRETAKSPLRQPSQLKKNAKPIIQEAKDAADKDRREKAMQAKYRAQRESEKLANQAKRIQKEIEDEKKEIAKVEEDKKRLVDEAAFQREYVKKAEDNVRSLQTVLDRISAADAAAEAAAKAAAAAAAAAAKK
jgi:prophage DNA circulation protein